MKTRITYRQYIKLFITFLKDNGVLKMYKKEIKKQHPNLFIDWYTNINPLLTSRLKNHLEHGIIDYSFTWAETEKGHDFWSVLNYKWNKKMINVEVVPETL